MDNNVTLVGNITRDPELRFTQGGQRRRHLRSRRQPSLPAERRMAGADLFFNVVAWAQLAENSASSLQKGSRVIVNGRLEQRSYETQDGEKRSVVEVVADEIGPSLRWATAQVERNERRSVEAGAGPAPGGRPVATEPFDEEPF